ncbi:MAG: hypothetical protein ACPLKQ_01145 [Candidatus Bathyarchaeales archaeon]
MEKKFSKTTITIAIILLTTSVVLMATPAKPVKGQAPQNQGGQPLPPGVTPYYLIETKAYLSFRPNPVGLNQIFLVNIWVSPALHRGRYHTSYVVEIQKPDGNIVKVGPMDSYSGDATAWFEYIADQEGTWKLRFKFNGSYFPEADVPGGFMEPSTVHLRSAYYEPSSTDWQELKVVEGLVVQSWPESPLPTDYWTRPVSPENREWWSILGDYPWYGPGGGTNWPENTNVYWSDRYRFIPYVQGPNSAHIVWKRQGALAGIMGGYMGQISYGAGEGTYADVPSIIFEGRCYQSVTKPFNGVTQTVWQCYDLRTGEIYWERTSVSAPSVIEYTGGGAAVPGAVHSQVGVGAALVYIGGGRLIKYHPWTGAVSLNESISPFTTGTYYRNGYALSVQTIGTKYYLINWTTLGTATTFKNRIITNISWPWSSIGVFDLNSGASALVSPITPPGLGAWYGTWMQIANLKTGALILNKTIEETLYSSSCVVADHGKVALLTMNGHFLAYNLNDGSLAWTSEKMDYPWDEPGFGVYSIASAYGLFYRNAYSGVYAFNWTNGKIVWKFEAKAPYPYEAPYTGRNGTTVYSFNIRAWIADGKYFISNGEHSPTSPLTRGWRLFCLNATTGNCIWNITGGLSPGPVADGYLTADNRYDGYMYVFGKGKSSTTVAVSPKTLAKGSQVLIEGSVLDMSPAQPGTPCVAKESMTVWMEYLHMQKPCPSDVKGVPVTLTAIKDDGKVIDLGTVTTNGFYGTFSYAWTPEEEGTYTIIASFAGDESYGSSAAATALAVGPPPAEIEIPEYPTPTDYTPILTGVIIAIIAIALLVVYTLYTVRKLARK